MLFLEFEINMAEKTHKSAVVEDDVLSCNSEYDESELSNDLVVCNKKVKTARSDNVPAKPRIIRGTAIKRKSSGPKGGSKPKSVKKSGPAKASSMGDIDKLKSQLGLDVIVNSLSSLTGIVQNIQSIQKKSVSNTTCTNSAPKPSQTLTAARSTGPSATLSRPPSSDEVVYESEYSEIVSVPENQDNYYPYVHIPSSPPHNYNYDDFNMDFLGSCSSQNDGIGVDPQVAFQNAYDNISDPGTGSAPASSNCPVTNVVPLTQTSTDLLAGGTNNDEQVDEFVWKMPQLDTGEKTGPKISSGLAKAVNAALTIKSNKDTISDIGKKYLRPENASYLCAPKCNREIWNAVGNFAHSKDLSLQEIQKFLALGLVPIVNLADKFSKKQHVDFDQMRDELSDSISLIGHSFYLLSNKRRQSIKPFLHDRYGKICSSDIPITNQLFGDNCASKLKEMGDISKYPIGKSVTNRPVPYRHYAQSNSGNLNIRGPVPNIRRGGGQGFKGQLQRGGTRQNPVPRNPRPLMSLPQVPLRGRTFKRQF